jgi:hypothetical protein
LPESNCSQDFHDGKREREGGRQIDRMEREKKIGSEKRGKERGKR